MACHVEIFYSDLLIGNMLLQLVDVLFGFSKAEIFRAVLHFAHTPFVPSRDPEDQFDPITIFSRRHIEHLLEAPLERGRSALNNPPLSCQG